MAIMGCPLGGPSAVWTDDVICPFGEAQMAVPIADDWKAINDRMQQIQAERSPSFGICPRCNN
jgi:hypothetical protein